MPLEKGSDNITVSKNISELMQSGYDWADAKKIAEQHAGRGKSDKPKVKTEHKNKKTGKKK